MPKFHYLIMSIVYKKKKNVLRLPNTISQASKTSTNSEQTHISQLVLDCRKSLLREVKIVLKRKFSLGPS